MIFQTEKELKEYGDKLPADKKEPIEKALSDLKEAHKNQDIEAIDKALNDLNTRWQAASEDIYKSAQAEAQPQAGPEQGPQSEGQSGKGSDDDEVTDVDFEEVK